MKLVEDPMFCHSIVFHEPDPKPFQHNDNNLVDAGPKDDNKIFKEEQIRNLFGLNGCEKETDPLPFELNDGDRIWRTPDLHCYISVNSLGNCNNSGAKDSVVPYTISSSKTDLLEDTDFYTDKSFTDCELPELIVCYKESYNPDVKDICVDEGLPTTDKIMVENGEEEPVGFFTSFSPDKDKDSDLTVEKVEIGLPVLDELKALEENSGNNDIFKHSDIEDTNNSDLTEEKVNILGELNSSEVNACNNDTCNQSDSENLDLTQEIEYNEFPVPDELKSSEVNACNNDTFNPSDSEDAENIDLTKEIESNEVPVPDELLSSAENPCGNKDESDTEDFFQNDETRNDAKGKIDSDVSKEKFVPENRLLEQDSGTRNSSFKSSENRLVLMSIQMPSGDTNSAKPTPGSVAEETNYSSIVDELSYNSKVESGSITFHFDSSTPAASGSSEGHQNVDHEPPLESPNAFRHEDVTSDHQKVSSQVQRDHGESSFSQISGLITYSGPIACSSSLSFRSESSTTSTRSFAFPVLQTEWNSSPVRMGKADRNRGWRQGLLCCRF